ncbi:MAG: NlpC/P60 family protein, partial [Pyrinomonadaceae bacterium]|nr:NlpC/P60 family protein [Sphingobacteriaceae bacterium]
KISLRESKPGDLILFTGTDSTVRKIGHMGIIASNNGSEIEFIHSTSGKALGVTTTPLNKYYQGRFVKALRIFASNN